MIIPHIRDIFICGILGHYHKWLRPEEINPENDLTDLNKADTIELDALPGIGPALAERIIAYREEHGGFSSIEEIKNVKGIGDALFEELRDLITAG